MLSKCPSFGVLDATEMISSTSASLPSPLSASSQHPASTGVSSTVTSDSMRKAGAEGGGVNTSYASGTSITMAFTKGGNSGDHVQFVDERDCSSPSPTTPAHRCLDDLVVRAGVQSQRAVAFGGVVDLSSHHNCPIVFSAPRVTVSPSPSPEKRKNVGLCSDFRCEEMRFVKSVSASPSCGTRYSSVAGPLSECSGPRNSLCSWDVLSGSEKNTNEQYDGGLATSAQSDCAVTAFSLVVPSPQPHERNLSDDAASKSSSSSLPLIRPTSTNDATPPRNTSSCVLPLSAVCFSSRRESSRASRCGSGSISRPRVTRVRATSTSATSTATSLLDVSAASSTATATTAALALTASSTAIEPPVNEVDAPTLSEPNVVTGDGCEHVQTSYVTPPRSSSTFHETEKPSSSTPPTNSVQPSVVVAEEEGAKERASIETAHRPTLGGVSTTQDDNTNARYRGHRFVQRAKNNYSKENSPPRRPDGGYCWYIDSEIALGMVTEAFVGTPHEPSCGKTRTADDCMKYSAAALVNCSCTSSHPTTPQPLRDSRNPTASATKSLTLPPPLTTTSSHPTSFRAPPPLKIFKNDDKAEIPREAPSEPARHSGQTSTCQHPHERHRPSSPPRPPCPQSPHSSVWEYSAPASLGPSRAGSPAISTASYTATFPLTQGYEEQEESINHCRSQVGNVFLYESSSRSGGVGSVPRFLAPPPPLEGYGFDDPRNIAEHCGSYALHGDALSLSTHSQPLSCKAPTRRPATAAPRLSGSPPPPQPSFVPSPSHDFFADYHAGASRSTLLDKINSPQFFRPKPSLGPASVQLLREAEESASFGGIASRPSSTCTATTTTAGRQSLRCIVGAHRSYSSSSIDEGNSTNTTQRRAGNNNGNNGGGTVGVSFPTLLADSASVASSLLAEGDGSAYTSSYGGGGPRHPVSGFAATSSRVAAVRPHKPRPQGSAGITCNSFGESQQHHRASAATEIAKEALKHRELAEAFLDKENNPQAESIISGLKEIASARRQRSHDRFERDLMRQKWRLLN